VTSRRGLNAATRKIAAASRIAPHASPPRFDINAPSPPNSVVERIATTNDATTRIRNHRSRTCRTYHRYTTYTCAGSNITQ